MPVRKAATEAGPAVRLAHEEIMPPGGHSFRVLRWREHVGDVEVVLGPATTVRMRGEGARWHYHTAMELTLFSSGAGARFVGDHIGRFGPGELVLLGERLPHYWHADGQSCGISIQWDFAAGHPFWDFPENLVLLGLFRNALRGIHYPDPAAAAIGQMLQKLADSSGPERLACFFSILTMLASATEHATFLSARSFSLPAGSGHEKAMAEAVRYLVSNFRQEIRLPDLLRLTATSKPSFSRLFKRHTGKTFSEFVAQLRLQAACRALAETDSSIVEIALSSGFSQLTFFNRIFRRNLGCSPSEWRKRQAASAR